MPVPACLMPIPENFQRGKCPFARARKFPKGQMPVCPCPINVCPLASLLQCILEVAIVYDVQYHKALSAVKWPKNYHICAPHPPKDDSCENTTVIECGRKWPRDIVNISGSKWNIVYIGVNDNFDCLLRFSFVNHSHSKYDPSGMPRVHV